jgi:antitoxin component YwqK of YwqJK toxin-antitoxin module
MVQIKVETRNETMRLLTLLLLCVTLTGHAQELPVYKGEILKRDGLSYKPFSNDPLTAKVEQYYESGQLKALYTVIDGKKEGLEQWWHANGQLWWEYTYVNGKKEGLERLWYENGQLCWEFTYVNGKEEGLYKNWYDDGQLTREATFVNGKEEGLVQWWAPSGKAMNSDCYKAGEWIDMSYCTKGKQP